MFNYKELYNNDTIKQHTTYWHEGKLRNHSVLTQKSFSPPQSFFSIALSTNSQTYSFKAELEAFGLRHCAGHFPSTIKLSSFIALRCIHAS